MKTTKLFLLLIFCLAAATGVFGQAKQISRKEYYQWYREAFKKRFEASRREVIKKQYYKDGKLSGTIETVNEFLKPDRQRYLRVEKSGGQTTKLEIIQTGKAYYCRKNDEDWTPSNKWCEDGYGSGLSNIVNSGYTVEKTKIDNQEAQIYQEYITYKNNYSPDKDKEALSYRQEKIWVDGDGFIVRHETESGLLEPRRIYSRETGTYEYNPKITIEAPVAAAKTTP
ncbi:MAG TPA: hypothetical protein VF721_11020 [Pyrinomonadaceae bacterium]|jgi:hypothetical protein